VTLVAQTHVPDAVYEQAKAQFSDEEPMKLTLLSAAINAWNRFAIPFRSIHPVAVKAAA
jgi:alkylhydroperoxidase family enzyme